MIVLYIYLASSILFRVLIIGIYKKKIEKIFLPGSIDPIWMAKCISLIPILNTLMIFDFIIRMIHKFIIRALCKHNDKTFIRNIYGDEINYLNCRSLWKCNHCKKEIKSDQLYSSETNQECVPTYPIFGQQKNEEDD